MPDVVEEGRIGDQLAALPGGLRHLALSPEVAEGRHREVVHPQGVIKAGVGGARIHQVGEAQLADIAQTLELRRVHDAQGGGIQTDGVP